MFQKSSKMDQYLQDVHIEFKGDYLKKSINHVRH